MAKLDDLPCEILQSIFSFQCQPYELFRNILTFRHINKTFRSITNDKDGFWQPLLHQFRNMEYFDQVGLYFPTHSFIAKLLFQTQKQKFRDFTDGDDKLVVYRTKGSDELICYEDNDEPQENLFEKFSDWLDAYSAEKEENIILKALIQIGLGREMIAHLGSNAVNVLIEMFFEKLLEPAFNLVNSWEEKPKEIEWKDQIVFNANLLQVIATPSLFSEDITACWNELDGITSCIPRKYLLYIAENFNGINTLIDGGNSTCMVTQTMKRLRDCGIKVERMRFSDLGKNVNYKRIESQDSLIPLMAKSFYLQHLAVWINSSALLEWCLTVGTKSQTNLAHLTNNTSLNIPLEAHVNTYIHDACGLTVLHYAVQRGNVELSELLINKYLANPFVISKIVYNDKKLTPCSLSQIEEENKEKAQIFQILFEKYGEDVKVVFKQNGKIKEVDRPNDDHKLYLEKLDADVWFDCGKDYSTSVQWSEKEEYEPLKEFVIVEDVSYRREEFDELSDDDGDEYGLSFPWIKNQIKNETSLKRKRNPTVDYVYNENLKKIKKPLEELEFVHWDDYQNEYIVNEDIEYSSDDERVPMVKILKRYPNSKEERDDSKEEEEENENTAQTSTSDDNMISEKKETIPVEEESTDSVEEQEEPKEKEQVPIGPEFILRKDLTIPKKRIDQLIQEILQDYRSDSDVIPNGRMLIQQACEHVISNNFTLAQAIAQFSGRDYIITSDVTLAGTLFKSTTVLKNDFGFLYKSRKTYTLQRYRDEFVENLNIQPKQVHKQLSKFIQDETILETLISTIEDKFESTYLLDDDKTTHDGDDEMDPDYDGESVHSSDSTFYSDDSMISNVCIEEPYFQGDSYEYELCYSVNNTADTFIKHKEEAIMEIIDQDIFVFENGVDLPTRLTFTTDRNRAIEWINKRGW